MPPEYKNIAINSCYSWAVQHLTQFSWRYLLTVGLYIARSHILSRCISYPTTKTKIKDIIILRSPLRLFILACQHNKQTNGKPSKTAFFLIHTAIVYTAAEERRLSLYCLIAFTSQKLCSNAFLVFQSYEAIVGTCPNLHRTRVSAHAIEKPLYFLFVIRSWILIPFLRHFAKRKNRYKVYEAQLLLLLLEKSITYGMVTYSTKEAGI